MRKRAKRGGNRVDAYNMCITSPPLPTTQTPTGQGPLAQAVTKTQSLAWASLATMVTVEAPDIEVGVVEGIQVRARGAVVVMVLCGPIWWLGLGSLVCALHAHPPQSQTTTGRHWGG